MQEHFPKIKELWIKEGWAEYIASLINIEYDQEELNKRMQFNTDEIYGKGFRKIKRIAEKYGNKGLIRFLNKRNDNVIEAD